MHTNNHIYKKREKDVDLKLQTIDCQNPIDVN